MMNGNDLMLANPARFFALRSAVARMMIVHGMSMEQVVERYPDVTLNDIQVCVDHYNTIHNNNSVGVCLGRKDEPYWEDEMETWTGKRTLDDCFSKLKYKDVEHEGNFTINELIS